MNILITIIVFFAVEYVENQRAEDAFWELMRNGLIAVESQGNPMSVNPDSGASGLYQIMPAYVDNVNSIQKSERFTLSDRFDPEKAGRMFDHWQSYYNKERDVIKAINIHLKGPAGHRKYPDKHQWYVDRVLTKMEEIYESTESSAQNKESGKANGDTKIPIRISDDRVGSLLVRTRSGFYNAYPQFRPAGAERGSERDEMASPGAEEIPQGVIGTLHEYIATKPYQSDVEAGYIWLPYLNPRTESGRP